ncbi:MAG: discoidin domain-containing protein [Pirellulaceae bacterium]|nr:discoidin domain-containing protein [Pirellulaceae bacterium]
MFARTEVSKGWLVLSLWVACWPTTGLAGDPHEIGENIALGKGYRLFPAPNYGLCTDPGDAQQLTDGQTTDQYFWTQTGTVGWQSVAYATITVDLQEIQPIRGASLTTAAGTAGVTWPMAVQILVSDDGRTFHDAGDLVGLDQQVRGAWPEGYAIRRLGTDQLRTRGRFVQFVLIPLPGGPYLFTDEVQVLRGPDAWRDTPPDPATATDARRVYEQGRLARSIRHRWQADLAGLERAIEGSTVDAPQRSAFLQRLQGLRKAEPDLIADAEAFRAVLPIGKRHAELFGLNAALWRAKGHDNLAVWAANPWDPLELFAPPESATGVVSVDTMLGEHRAATVNLANSTDSPLDLRLRFDAESDSPFPACVRLHQVVWTDTAQGIPVASALPELARDADGWRVTVLPGLVSQIWMSFRPSDESPGRHEGDLVIEGAGIAPARVPLAWRIWPLRMPQEKSLWLGGWSYTDAASRYGVTAENREEFIQHLQQRCVNAPWASAAVLMSFEFDPAAPEKIRLDTSALDRWIDLWPDAKTYMVFLSVAHYSGTIRSSLGGADIGSPEFQRRVGTWITAWVKHLRSRGIEANRLALLIHDEPHEGSDVTALLAWARAIQAAEPDVIVWEDPTYRDPAAAPAEVFEVCDILCPNRPMWLERGDAFRDFYRNQQRRGRTLQFYSCSGPAKLLDPYSYYRLQAWHSWHVGGTGSFFWAFGDNSGASSWNEYFAKGGPYTPLFLDETTVTAGKQMEAIRESSQDYEYFVMLRKAVEQARAAGRNDAAVERGQKLLDEAAAEVLMAEGAAGLKWHDAKDRGIADRVRTQILETLTALQPVSP